MRRTFVIVIGSILLCGLVMAAMVPADPQPTTVTVNITGQELEGVDIPFFVLDRSNSETVKWHNSTDKNCILTISGGPPFGPPGATVPHQVVVPPGGDSAAYKAADAQGPPQGWPDHMVYKVYHYTVNIVGGPRFESPGGGVKP